MKPAAVVNVLFRLFPWLGEVTYRLRLLADPAHRAAHRVAARKFEHLKASISNAFAAPIMRSGRPFLFYGFSDVASTSLERFVIAGFEKAGLRPVILLPFRAGPKRGAYEIFGLTSCISLGDYGQPVAEAEIDRMMAGVRSFDDLLALTHQGVRVGKYTVSTVMRQLRKGTLDLSSDEVRAACREGLGRSMAATAAARELLTRIDPAALVLVDTGYTPFGELFDWCMGADIPVYTWHSAHRNGLLNLKRYARHNMDRHPISLSKETWAQAQEMAWSQEKWNELRGELEDGYTKGEWFAEVGTQFNTRIVQKAELVRRLGLNPDHKTVVLFPHIFWDATFFWGVDLFDNYEDWFCQCLKVAAASPHLNWIIKVHPANRIKDRRDGWAGEHSEVIAIREVLGEVPAHIRVLEADTEISTLSLFDIMDYCLTVRGTVGIEAACRGITVLTAGTGRYDGLGFTVDSTDRPDYLRRLEDIASIPAMDAGQIELARRFAYCLFIVRAVTLRSVTYDYSHDSAADMQTRLTVSDPMSLLEAADVTAVAEWIRSGADDFCAWTDHLPQ